MPWLSETPWTRLLGFALWFELPNLEIRSSSPQNCGAREEPSKKQPAFFKNTVFTRPWL